MRNAPSPLSPPSANLRTLQALTSEVRQRLNAAGLEGAREARLLIQSVADLAPETFLMDPHRPIEPGVRRAVMAACERRSAREPLARIVGERMFYGRPFALGPETLEPRDDSEVLVEAALELVDGEGWRERPIRIVDVGTGTGCLLITLLAELAQATGVGVDIAAGAVAAAAGNARRHNVSNRSRFVAGDALSGIGGPFDLLISNPPYIRREDIAGLGPEVRDHDPHLALDGGLDGLQIYRAIGRDIVRVVPNGWALFEVGAGMAEAVRHEIDGFVGEPPDSGWRIWQDLDGHERCVARSTLHQP